MFIAIRKKFCYGEKGFTLIELLVVVAVLGALAAVAIPNVGRFIGQGDTEAARTELRNIQTALMALMADQNVGELDNALGYSTNDMSTVTANGIALSVYLSGLTVDGVTQSGASYDFTSDGQVSATP